MGDRGVRKAVATWMATVVPVPRRLGKARVLSICAASHSLSEHTDRQTEDIHTHTRARAHTQRTNTHTV